jgi:hypothetical protein
MRSDATPEPAGVRAGAYRSDDTADLTAGHHRQLG